MARQIRSLRRLSWSLNRIGIEIDRLLKKVHRIKKDEL
jgi:hypothetical protein